MNIPKLVNESARTRKQLTFVGQTLLVLLSLCVPTGCSETDLKEAYNKLPTIDMRPEGEFTINLPDYTQNKDYFLKVNCEFLGRRAINETQIVIQYKERATSKPVKKTIKKVDANGEEIILVTIIEQRARTTSEEIK